LDILGGGAAHLHNQYLHRLQGVPSQRGAMADSTVTSLPSTAEGIKVKAPVDSMDKLYGSSQHSSAHIAKLTSYSWNIFRYIGDYLHLFGVFVLLLILTKNRSCKGVSRSTQLLYFTVFVTRYLDLLDHSQTAYLVFFKLTYIITSVIILCIFWKLDATYERQKDTCSLAVIYLPCITAAMLLANENSLLEMLWTLSQFLEGFAMVPQYIFCYRDRAARDISVSLYVTSLGGYRVFYAANWIYKKVQMPHYSDVHSWIGGIIEISFFSDYLLSRCSGYSLLRALVLKVDEKINEIQDKVEMKVLGSSRLKQLSSASGDCELRQRRRGEEVKELEAMDV